MDIISEDLSGLTIKGYELSERIGAGGFGAVYRASQSTVGRQVAVKIILPGFANQPEFIRRFESEAQLIARLEHLHIVPLYDYWRDPSGAYLVMRWMRGGSLREGLVNNSFTLQATAQLLDQVTAGLAVAHRNSIVHRDIKPANILFDEEGNAYLSDFGIAKDLKFASGRDSDGKNIVGSPDYLSPEQARGEEVSSSSDIYSLGVVLYEMITGHHPFPGNSSVERLFKHINDPLPPIEPTNVEDINIEAINAVVQKATAKNPKRRYQDGIELASAFRKAAGLDVTQQPVTIEETLTPREQEILRLIVEGCSNKEIAQTLFIELSTVKWFITNIYRKLGVRSRVQAMVRARELQLIVPAQNGEEFAATSGSISIVLPEPDNPYKGLRPFEAADSRDFFGREDLARQLLDRLDVGEGSKQGSRFLAVVGPSGSGKSSLVKAGLIPSIWRGEIPGSDTWFVVEMVPGARPLDELEVALMRIAANQAEKIRQQLERDRFGLLRVAGLILPNDGSELLLIIDQFEELFALVDEEAERRRFLDLLYAAVADPKSRVRVVITLRADYYHRPLEYPDFGRLIQRRSETLLPLSAGELERVIERPSEQVGVHFEPGLVATIIEDVHYQPGALPLLQYALTELFDRSQNRQLSSQAYEEIGGIVGALANRAEGILQELDEAGQETTRQMFLRLASLEGADDGELSNPVTRRRVKRSELLDATDDPEQMEEIVDTFAAYRLLSLDHDPHSRQPTVELSHEAIMVEWKRLHYWLEESREDIRLQRLLSAASEWWEGSGRDPGYLLRDARLDQFIAWSARTDLALTESEASLLNASEEARQSRQERRRKDAAERQRLRRRVTQLLVAGLIIAVLLAVLAGIGWWQATQAQQAAIAERDRTRSALSRLLAAQALTFLDTRLDLALLLAVEAIQLEPNLETSSALQAAINHDPNLAGNLGQPADSAVFDVAFSPDGGLIASAGADSAVTVWDFTSRQPIYEPLEGHKGAVKSVTFSPDGRTLASAGNDGQIRLWNVSSGELIGLPLKGHDGSINSLDFSPDGSLLASGGVDRSVMVWDQNPLQHDPTGSLLLHNFQHPASVVALDFSPYGRKIAVGLGDGTAVIWDLETDEPAGHLVKLHEKEITGIKFNPDQTLLATTSIDGNVKFWPVAELLTKSTQALNNEIDGLAEALTVNSIATFEHVTGLRNLAFLPDGSRLIVGSDDGLLFRLDADPTSQGFGSAVDEPLVSNYMAAPTGLEIAFRAKFRSLLEVPGINSVAISDDGRLVAAATNSNTVTLLDLSAAAGAGQRVVENIEDLQVIGFQAGSERLVSVSCGATNCEKIKVQYWDASTGQPVDESQLLSNDRLAVMHKNDLFSKDDSAAWPWHNGQISADLSPDGRLLAVSYEDNTVVLWDVISGERFDDPLTTGIVDPDSAPHGAKAAVTLLEFSTDGDFLVAGGCGDGCEQGLITIWDLKTRKPVEKIDLGKSSGRHPAVIALSPEASYVAVTTTYNQSLWDMTGSEPSPTYISFFTLSLGFSADGRRLLGAQPDATMVMWDVNGLESITFGFPAFGGPVVAVAHDPATDRWVTAGCSLAEDQITELDCANGEVWLWDLIGDQLVGFSLRGNGDLVHDLAFSSDGKLLASASRDNNIIIWDLDQLSAVERACQLANRNMDPIEWERFFGDEPYRATCSDLAGSEGS